MLEGFNKQSLDRSALDISERVSGNAKFVKHGVDILDLGQTSVEMNLSHIVLCNQRGIATGHQPAQTGDFCQGGLGDTVFV